MKPELRWTAARRNGIIVGSGTITGFGGATRSQIPEEWLI